MESTNVKLVPAPNRDLGSRAELVPATPRPPDVRPKFPKDETGLHTELRRRRLLPQVRARRTRRLADLPKNGDRARRARRLVHGSRLRRRDVVAGRPGGRPSGVRAGGGRVQHPARRRARGLLETRLGEQTGRDEPRPDRRVLLPVEVDKRRVPPHVYERERPGHRHRTWAASRGLPRSSAGGGSIGGSTCTCGPCTA
ncbi:hypothetical protein VT84_12740 [Gemmata sp. SH-PL17]|nr:hypothetical protein VT84_12740 [Gemmata sp. SH-PL17]